jgi:hypothetical protein
MGVEIWVLHVGKIKNAIQVAGTVADRKAGSR